MFEYKANVNGVTDLVMDAKLSLIGAKLVIMSLGLLSIFLS